jgi:hypothetical protein
LRCAAATGESPPIVAHGLNSHNWALKLVEHTRTSV